MPSVDQNRDPEVQKIIELILRALAKCEIPAVVVVPSDDLADARSELERFVHSGNDPKRLN
jgi:hypothetical protein